MNNWLFGRNTDLLVLFAPVWLCWLAAFLLPEAVLYSEVPLWVWVVFVIGIDVSHVWSSIHRTYFDSEEFANHRRIFIVAPLLSLVLSFGIAAISIDLFWRCLAYVAVYHFVKQQFGFMRIYKAKAGDFRSKKIGDNFIIYFSMLYPVIFWHLSPGRRFAWFVAGDFLMIPDGMELSPLLFSTGNLLYFGLLFFWLAEEIYFWKKSQSAFPTGKILWVMTTAWNWFLGIVYYNSDLVFTITNVVAHGVPYLALVIIYQTKKKMIRDRSSAKYIRVAMVVVLSVFVFAIMEEYLWDLLVYRENEPFFSYIMPYTPEEPAVILQLIAIGILAVPQVTHYILDGFIWKNNERNPYIKKTLLQ